MSRRIVAKCAPIVCGEEVEVVRGAYVLHVNLYLVLSVLFDCFHLVESLQVAVHALVKTPRSLHRNVHLYSVVQTKVGYRGSSCTRVCMHACMYVCMFVCVCEANLVRALQHQPECLDGPLQHARVRHVKLEPRILNELCPFLGLGNARRRKWHVNPSRARESQMHTLLTNSHSLIIKKT